MNMPAVWLTILILGVLIEIMTLHFGTIAFSAGALGGLIAYSLGAELPWQIVIFIITASLALALLRPLAGRLQKNQEDTRFNANAVIGKQAIVTEDIRYNHPGAVKVQGKEWTAIVQTPGVNLVPGDTVRVKEIQGVKLVVDQLEKE